MATNYRGKYYGICRHCGGAIIKDWGGAIPEFHCESCGITTAHSGRRPAATFTSEDLARTVKEVMDEMGLDTLSTAAVINMMKKHCKVRPQIRRDSLNEHGLDFANGIIYRTSASI